MNDLQKLSRFQQAIKNFKLDAYSTVLHLLVFLLGILIVIIVNQGAI